MLSLFPAPVLQRNGDMSCELISSLERSTNCLLDIYVTAGHMISPKKIRCSPTQEASRTSSHNTRDKSSPHAQELTPPRQKVPLVTAGAHPGNHDTFDVSCCHLDVCRRARVCSQPPFDWPLAHGSVDVQAVLDCSGPTRPTAWYHRRRCRSGPTHEAIEAPGVWGSTSWYPPERSKNVYGRVHSGEKGLQRTG